MDTNGFRKIYGGGMFDYEWVKSCPICGGKGEWIMAVRQREGDLKVVIQVYMCMNCHVSYHNPRMTQESMMDYYSSGKYRTFECRVPDPIEKDKGNRARTEWFKHAMDLNPKRYLDVGCAEGYMVRAVKEKYGCEAVGYDVYEDPNALIPVVLDRDKVEGKFDLITCIHVLEHLYDPLEMLNWIESKLSDDGIVYLEVPLYHQLIIPHPIIYSRKSLPMLIKKMGLYGVVVDMKPVEIGIMLAKRTPFDLDFFDFPYDIKTDAELEKMKAGLEDFCVTLYPERGRMPNDALYPDEWLEGPKER